MKHLRIFEEFQTEAEDLTNNIREYLITEYPKDWWENEFQNRLDDYITEDDLIGYGSEEEPDYESNEEAYKELCSGGAIEYDLITEITKDIKDKFNLTDDECYKIKVSDLIENQMVNMVDWYDHMIFGETKSDPSDPFGLNKGVRDLMSRYDKYNDL